MTRLLILISISCSLSSSSSFCVEGFVQTPMIILPTQHRYQHHRHQYYQHQHQQHQHQRHNSISHKDKNRIVKMQLLPNDYDYYTELMTTITTGTTTTSTSSNASLLLLSSSMTLSSLTVFEKVIGVVVIGLITFLVLFSGWLYIDGADDRVREQKRAEQNQVYNQYQEERYKNCVVEYQEYWTLEEIAQYSSNKNKNEDENEDAYDDNENDGPILFAADGIVFNVYKGRNFYGPYGEYSIFAGRDATRLLARGKLEEETEQELQKPLSIADRAALATWIFTFKQKYDIVGTLKDFDKSITSM